jgi:hypothetical protein
MEDPLRAAQAGEVYKREGEEERLSFYEQGDPVCTLTLDQKQAWVLASLLHPYKQVEPEDWEFVRAASDVRRRLADALGYE